MRHPKDRPSRPGSVSRRDFLRGGAAVAAGIPLAGSLLAACGNPREKLSEGQDALPLATKTSPVTMPLYDDNPPIESDLPLEQGATLKLYNFDAYTYKKVLDDFGAKYKCKVELSTFQNQDEALAKIRSGQMDFDVAFFSPDIFGKLVLGKLVRPLNPSYLPNLAKNVWPEFSAPDQPFYDVGHRYSVPYTVWSTGIGWRNDMVDEKDDPWHIKNPYDVLWNAKYAGKIGIYDDYREATAMVLLRNGGADPNSCIPEELTRAKDALIEMIDRVNVALSTNGAYEDLPKGIFAAHQAWSGDIINAQYYGKENAAQTAPLLSYWWPKDAKGVAGNDMMLVLTTGKNPVLAHTFLNYMLDFEVAMKNFSWVGYQPPQLEAPPEAFGDPRFKWDWMVPDNLGNCILTHEDYARSYFDYELSPECDVTWHDDWEEFTSGV